MLALASPSYARRLDPRYIMALKPLAHDANRLPSLPEQFLFDNPS